MSLEAGQLYWDEGGKNFILLLGRMPCDEQYWRFIVYYPHNGTYVHIQNADPWESITLHCKRIY